MECEPDREMTAEELFRRYITGDNESFEITHTVNSRSVFAKGALKAARFIVNQKNGMYSMKDLF